MLRSISTEELICRCASSEIGAWEEFVRRFHRVIAAAVLRTASRLGDKSTPTVDDLIQETYLKLCAHDFKLLRDFRGAHPESFFGFVCTIASNLVRDHFKSIYSDRRGQHLPHQGEELLLASSDLATMRDSTSMTHGLLMSEVDDHLRASTEGQDQSRNRRVFWLYYRTGFSASDISALPGIGLTTKGVESLLGRLTREIGRRMNNTPKGTNPAKSGFPEGISPA